METEIQFIMLLLTTVACLLGASAARRCDAWSSSLGRKLEPRLDKLDSSLYRGRLLRKMLTGTDMRVWYMVVPRAAPVLLLVVSSGHVFHFRSGVVLLLETAN